MGSVRTPIEDVRSDIQEMFGKVPEWLNEVPVSALPAFWSLLNYQLGETTIPNKYKELMGLAVSGATRCRYCALFHTEAARLHGATEEEIAEASLLGGFSMMASTFLNAKQVDYDTFRTETLDAVAYIRKQAAKKPDVKRSAGAERF